MNRAALVVVVLVLVSAFAARANESEMGVELVPWSKKVATHRYESPRDFDATVKHFRDKFKGNKSVRWSREVSLPTVKYIHLESLAPGTSWEAVNIYLMPEGRVRYYFLTRDEAKAAPKTGTASTQAKG